MLALKIVLFFILLQYTSDTVVCLTDQLAWQSTRPQVGLLELVRV